MAAELGLLSLTQLQKFSQLKQDLQPIIPNQKPSSATAWMWNVSNQATALDDDDSWEVRAFAEDTGNIMGTTWPPRSYTCTFCRREFRSAQALGGHMNVHRRDRARLHQVQPNPNCHPISTSSPNTTTLLIPTTPQELVANGGLCLLYSLPNPNMNCLNPSSSTINNRIIDTTTTPSTISPSISPCAFRNFISSHNFQTPPAGQNTVGSSLCHSGNTTEEEGFTSTDNNYYNNQDSSNKREKKIELSFVEEEIDLELRLGRCRSSSSF